MTTTPNLDKATEFIWSTARLLDRRRFAYLFRDGDSQAVLAALRPYRNPDGGFGNGLEPDIRGPESQPVPTWTALGVFDETGTMGDLAVSSICDYLVSITTAEGGVPFILPSARDYPHAPWWETEGIPPASLNPTAAIAALLHKHQVEHPWLNTATEFCWRQIERMDQTSPYEMRAVLPFLDYVPDRRRAEAAFDRIGAKILEQRLVALTPTTEEETHSPLNFAPRPDCLARRLFADDVIAANLEVLADSQQEDGGWKFNWLAWNPAAALEWRAIVTIESLVTLKAYGRDL